ncbi:MAG: hypothetical protein KBC02_01200 [Candidatus Pacebacteria bacterium]|nr:hypothetical protein [Candidatus Paceibacterota bacterium]
MFSAPVESTPSLRRISCTLTLGAVTEARIKHTIDLRFHFCCDAIQIHFRKRL